MRQAFSLVELSIVLVILGLLTGGILSGQSLIRAAEARAVATEYSKYVAATQSFRDKYFSIPGDFSSATKFWGRTVNATDCVTNSSAAVATPGTCDGNGDGIMQFPTAVSLSGEIFQFWRQLANAGLIEGTYTGIAGSGGVEDSTISVNVPFSKLPSGGWSAQSLGAFVGDPAQYAMDYGGNVFVFGAKQPNSKMQNPVLKPEEAWNVDTKLDDGKPASGKVIARYWNNACSAADDGTHANNDLVASYKLSDATIQCALFFRSSY